MTAALNLLAVQNAPVLRALRDRPEGGWPTIADLADHLKRDRSNLSKTLNKLEDERLAAFNPLIHGLTDAGAEQLAMIDRAERGGDDEPGSPADAGGVVFLTHAQILPDPANARRDWDSDEARDDLDSLRSDILQNGLLQNLVVRGPEADIGGVRIANGQGEFAPLYTLVGGERRWRAIGIAITDGDWEVDTPIPCRLLDTDDLGHRLAALAENLQRRNLNPIEKANAFEGLALAGLTNKEIADRVSSTPEHVQQHRRFLQLDADDQARMTLGRDDPRHLSVREARQKLAAKSAESDRAAKLVDTPINVRLAYAEFIHRRAREANYTWADLIVQPDARVSETGKALAELDWVRFTEASRTYGGDKIGHFTASQGYGAPRLFDWQHSDDEATRDAGLAALRKEANAMPAEGYATAWLNPPSERTPEGQALYDEHIASVEAIRLKQQANEAREQEMRDLWRTARARHAERLARAQAAPVETTPDETRQIAADIGRPLPWTATDDGMVLDAKGRQIMTFGNYNGCSDQGLVTAQLIVVAANGAAGLATPAAPASEVEGDLDEEDFVDVHSVVLGAAAETDEEVEAANATADRLLADFLEENGIEFGDEGFEWTREAAETMAREHLNPEGDGEAADEDEAAA
ncbi:Chromosome-partitioning protein Spo0J [compost metagenome]